MSKNEDGRLHYLCEEMKISCYQLENGVTEEQVYQEFGRRCKRMQYRRLGFLLSVHLKQGNSRLLAILSQEADSAQEDERNLARKAGEEEKEEEGEEDEEEGRTAMRKLDRA